MQYVLYFNDVETSSIVRCWYRDQDHNKLVLQFTQHIKIMEKEDQEVARLAQLVKNYFIPPMNMPPSGHSHYRHWED